MVVCGWSCAPPARASWNEFIARYHHLGYTSVGAQMRYAVLARDDAPLAMPGLDSRPGTASSADHADSATGTCRLSPKTPVRDLLEIHIPNRGSHIRALVPRQLPHDWTALHGRRPPHLRASGLRSRCFLGCSELWA